MIDNTNTPHHFLDLIKKSRQGKFKIYLGMSAGVGKTYRMLQEAQSLMKNGIDVKIGYVEVHDRVETRSLLPGLTVIPRQLSYYKGKAMEEMDLQAILNLRPEVVIIDELAHTNVVGCKNEKRWQDVIDILNSGINVISAVNIQHLESLHDIILKITGIDVAERIPDRILNLADEVVNIDLTADELINRIKEGKVYQREKIETALANFFRREHLLQLRELALKEVATQLERKIEDEVPTGQAFRHEIFLACISSNAVVAKTIIRKTSRLASYYHSHWFVLYVQTPLENTSRIALDRQRHLINNFKLATELGAELIRVNHKSIAKAILETAKLKGVTTICIGKPHLTFLQTIFATNIFKELLKKMTTQDIDLVILS